MYNLISNIIFSQITNTNRTQHANTFMDDFSPDSSSSLLYKGWIVATSGLLDTLNETETDQTRRNFFFFLEHYNNVKLQNGANRFAD